APRIIASLDHLPCQFVEGDLGAIFRAPPRYTGLALQAAVAHPTLSVWIRVDDLPGFVGGLFEHPRLGIKRALGDVALRIHDAHGAAHGVTEVAGYATQAVLHLGVVVGLVVGEPHPVDAAHVSTLWI